MLLLSFHVFQPQVVDWEGSEDQYFGCPSFIGKDINEMSETGLLSLNRNGHMYLVVGVQLDIPLIAFDILSLLHVSKVMVIFHILMMDIWIACVLLLAGTRRTV